MSWRVPLSDLILSKEDKTAVLDVLDSGWLTMGDVTQRFEEAFAEMVGVRHAIAVSNATVGLHLALLALQIRPGDEVILPSLSFVATANAVLYIGATPVFAEVMNELDFGISIDSIERQITDKTKAIIAMHYGGNLCSMTEIIELAKAKGLSVIEDAAHAPGASLNGRNAGAWVDIGCFSFFSNKNMATGEGGMVVTDRDDLAEKVRLLRSHGMTTLTLDRHGGHAFSYDVVDLGFNYRIDEMRSALGLVQLDKLEENNRRRREISDRYRSDLQDVPMLSIPYADYPGISAAHIFPVLLDKRVDRKAFMEVLKTEGIQTSIHYPPIHQFSYYRQRFGEMDLPVTEDIGRREVTLPLFPTMTEEQIELVVEAVKKALATVEIDPSPLALSQGRGRN